MTSVNDNDVTELKQQWIEISPISSFTTKWGLFSSMNSSFGNVINVMINHDNCTAKYYFHHLNQQNNVKTIIHITKY